jgi:hypothetical protein
MQPGLEAADRAIRATPLRKVGVAPDSPMQTS